MRTALIGLGSMGMAMAKNMLAANIALTGFDVSEKARQAFVQMGGVAAGSVVEAARDADVLILMVVDAAQVREVLLSAAESQPPAVSVLSAGAVVVVCSTIAPSDVYALENDLKNYDVALVDAPVSGGKAGAEAGTLTIMASGASAALQKARPALAAISKKIYALGNKAGMGSTYKVVHQLAAGVHLVAAAELMALGQKAGCDPQTLFDIVSTSAGQSWMFNDRVPHMLTDDFQPRSTVDIFVKDLGLVLQEGKALHMPLPLTAAAHQMLLAASGMGHGAKDDAAVVCAYQTLAGSSKHADSA